MNKKIKTIKNLQKPLENLNKMIGLDSVKE